VICGISGLPSGPWQPVWDVLSFGDVLVVVPVERELQSSSLEEMKAWTSFSASDGVKVGRSLEMFFR